MAKRPETPDRLVRLFALSLSLSLSLPLSLGSHPRQAPDQRGVLDRAGSQNQPGVVGSVSSPAVQVTAQGTGTSPLRVAQTAAAGAGRSSGRWPDWGDAVGWGSGGATAAVRAQCWCNR